MKVGDKVKIRNTSQYYMDGDSWNPKDTLGEVINFNQWNSLPFLVMWENGEENAYGEEDLEIINEI
jgi:hypothetical protein